MDTATASDAIDALIARRAEGRNAANEREAIWRASVEAHHAEHREANRHAWITYFRRAAANYRGLAERMEARAEEVKDLEV